MIRLFNSLSQQKEPFEPRDPGKAGIYCCGPTVYNLVHIGNARPYVTFAVLRSWLAYRGLDVTLVTNITDVDDKIINKANAEGRDSAAVAEEYTAAYVEDTGRLGIPRPDIEPKATETIAEIIDLVCQLVCRRPCLRGRRQRLLQGAQLRRVRQAQQAAHRRARGGRARRHRARQGRPARLRRLEGRQAGRAGLGQPVGHGPARLAHRVLRHGPALPGRGVRRPRRRPRPHLPAPRERDRPERGRAACRSPRCGCTTA